jgi:hypothetical protein
MLGTDALAVPQDQATMQLGILNKLNNEDEFRRTVLHEFGHVLGLLHENQQPNADIPWNKDVVYEFYAKPPWNWSRDVVAANIFPESKLKINGYRAFDRDSIMMYIRIPKEFLKDSSFPPVTNLSTTLSESDKDFAKKLYPPSVTAN